MHVILFQIEIEIVIWINVNIVRSFVSIFRFSLDPFIDLLSLVASNLLRLLLLLLSTQMCNVHSHEKMMCLRQYEY